MLVLSYGLGSLVAGSAELGRASLGAGGPQPSLSRSAWSQRGCWSRHVPSGGVIQWECKGLPARARCASPSASLCVGCGVNQARDISRETHPSW